MVTLRFFAITTLVTEVIGRAAFLRDRPRGLGLLQLPTGMTDERSAPFFPNLYMAGDKAGEKPASVPDVYLPGQMAVRIHLTILGVNELFDIDGRIMLKGGGNRILNSARVPADPNERAPYTFKYLNFMADRHMQYGQVVPNVNLFTVGKDKIMSRLTQNTLNPNMVG
ncbi:unnamed protein product [Heligmosomoides polygyrus]|uniref:GSDH domain-containing protein n=1 Tax=Heligmosomoides polygyrus TaxID=6339 RepID=A0A183GUE9_HELPZ|nr:unnamed protein product [Heligmosomoides polygyrus]